MKKHVSITTLKSRFIIVMFLILFVGMIFCSYLIFLNKFCLNINYNKHTYTIKRCNCIYSISETIKNSVEYELKEIKNKKTHIKEKNKKYTEEDVYILSHLIYGEAGSNSKELKIGVGSVVLNRVKDKRFPNTIKDVVFQNGQYACTWDGNYNKKPNKESIEIAIFLLENGSQYPEYVIFHSDFLQGDSIYKTVENAYFCYWKEDVK